MFKNKISWDLKFTPEQREKWVNDMFKKYWSDGVEIQMVKKRVPVTENGAMKRRACSCVKGYYCQIF